MNYKKSWQSSVKEIGPYIYLGIQLTISMVIGVFGGLWLDGKLKTTPLFLIIGFFLGAITGFWSIYKSVYLRKSNKSNRDTE